jgi:phage terminase large subunit
VEEAYEILESDFQMIDESIRGDTGGLFKQLSLSFNPWDASTWLKKRFFDTPDTEDKLSMTTTFRCNEWLDKNDIKLYESIYTTNPRRAKVACDGDWGVLGDTIFERFSMEAFDIEELLKDKNNQALFGLDWGYTNDPSAFIYVIANKNSKVIYICDEFYQTRMSNEMIANKIKEMGFAKEIIIADSSEPKSIEQIRGLGLNRIRPAQKGPDSVINGISNLQDYMIYIHPKCKNFYSEISTYTWQKDKNGITLNKPVDQNNHLLDALRYATENLHKPKNFSF